MANEISEITRRNICDTLVVEEIHWYGRLDDLAFLKRIFANIYELPSNDSRFTNLVGDIRQHRINNYDWPDDWIFSDDRLVLLTCPDSLFVQFLCETVHPVVRKDQDEVRHLVDMYNQNLKFDGWELYESTKKSGKSIYSAKIIADAASNQIEEAQRVAEKLSSAYVSKQIKRIQQALGRDDPELAIGSAKEFLETICKAIHEHFHFEIKENIEMPQLLKSTRKLLKILPENINENGKGAKVIKKLLGNLGGVASGMGEIRNLFGTGHGKKPATVEKSAIEMRHAKLATGAAITLAVFFYETYEERHKNAAT